MIIEPNQKQIKFLIAFASLFWIDQNELSFLFYFKILIVWIGQRRIHKNNAAASDERDLF